MEFKFFCVCLTISYFAISRDVVRLFPVFFFFFGQKKGDGYGEREREKGCMCLALRPIQEHGLYPTSNFYFIVLYSRESGKGQTMARQVSEWIESILFHESKEEMALPMRD